MKSTLQKFRCGECLHHKQLAHPTQGSVCSKLGVPSSNEAPRCFSPDVTQLVDGNEDLATLALMFGGMSAKQRRAFLAVLLTNTKKRPYPIGQKLYFRAVGGDYIANYLAGFVMGYTSTGQVILCGTPDNRTRGSMYLAYMDEENLLIPHLWRKKRQELFVKGKLQDPRNPLQKVKKVDVDYEPPTLDTAPKEWKEKTQKKKYKSTDESVKDLTILLHESK